MPGVSAETYLRDMGPQDVDTGGSLVRDVGVHNQGRALIVAVANSRDKDLATVQAWPEDYNRSRFLDLSETEKAFAKSDHIIDDSTFISARVHGRSKPEDEKVVVALLEAPSGRTYRAAIPYSELSKSSKEYGKAVDAGSVHQGPSDAAATQQIDALTAEVANLRRQLAAEARSSTPVNPDRDDSGGGEGLVDQKADEVKKDLADASDEDLAAALEAEKAGKDRVTVVEAIEAEQASRATGSDGSE